jgi:hypothetical protein
MRAPARFCSGVRISPPLRNYYRRVVSPIILRRSHPSLAGVGELDDGKDCERYCRRKKEHLVGLRGRLEWMAFAASLLFPTVLITLPKNYTSDQGLPDGELLIREHR